MYTRLMDTSLAPVDSVSLVKLCRFETSPGVCDCTGKPFARGYCEKHYRALRRAGAFDSDIRKHTTAQALMANVASVKRARKKLLKHAPDFVDHLLHGSKIASQNGKTDAAQWALTHTRTIEPVGTSKEMSSTPTTQINIGVKVSGVKQGE